MGKASKKTLEILRKGREKLAALRKRGLARRGKNKPTGTGALVTELRKRGYKVTKM